MRIAIMFVIVSVIAGAIFKGGEVTHHLYVNSIVPVFEKVGEFFTPYSWEKSDSSPEADAKEFVLKIVPDALYSWGSETVDGLPIEFRGHPDVRYIQDKSGKRLENVNMHKEVRDLKLPIIMVRFDSVKPGGEAKANRLVNMTVFVQIIGPLEKPFSQSPTMLNFNISVEFKVTGTSSWKPVRVVMYTPGTSRSVGYSLFSKYPEPEYIARIYINKLALKNKVFQGYFNYDDPDDRLEHLAFNSRDFH